MLLDALETASRQTKDAWLHETLAHSMHTRCTMHGVAVLAALWHAVFVLEIQRAARPHCGATATVAAAAAIATVPKMRTVKGTGPITKGACPTDTVARICIGWHGSSKKASMVLADGRRRATDTVMKVAPTMIGCSQLITTAIVVPLGMRLVAAMGSDRATGAQLDAEARLLARCESGGGNLAQVTVLTTALHRVNRGLNRRLKER